MKHSTPLLILICIISLRFQAQVISIGLDADQKTMSFKTGDDVLSHVHQTYRNGPCKAYTFSQTNTHYRNDSMTGTSEWHEAVEFPDKFRIDFGDKATGNYVIFRNDSSYRYKHFELRGKKYDANILLLVLGGMYYRELSDVTARLRKGGYNTTILSKQKWNKQHVYVIGAEAGDLNSNQIWISKKTGRVARIIERMEGNDMMDMTFDSHQDHCKGYVETKVTFKRNGKIEQVEEYHHIQTVEKFPEEVFDPAPVKK